MKLMGILGILVLACFAEVKADDFLANSDFSNGSAGWSGDGADAMNPGDPFAKASSSTGLTLPLHSTLATRIYQIFRTSDDEVTFTLVCTPSPGCKFTGTAKVAKVASDLDPEVESTTYQVGTGQWRTVINPNYREYMSTFSTLTMLIVDRDLNQVHPYPLQINPSSAEPQTITMPMGFTPHKEFELYIAFPPGEGSITLNKVSIAKGQARPAAPPIPNSADNILAKQTWSGDVGDADENGGDMGGLGGSSANPTGDLTVRLHAGSVARIYGTFRAPAPSLRFTIMCTPAPHCEYVGTDRFTTVGDIVRKANQDNSEDSAFAQTSGQSSPAASDETSKMPIFAITLILVDQKTKEVRAFPLSFKAERAETQTDTFLVPATPDDEYNLLLAFPTGHGSFTLNNVFLTKA